MPSTGPSNHQFQNKAARMKLAKDTINHVTPHILRTNTRARNGVSKSTTISYSQKPMAKNLGSDAAESATLKSIPNQPPTIRVIQSDTFDALQIMMKNVAASSGRTAVLSMASALRPGGGVLNGNHAQEESLCLRSTLYASLRDEYYCVPEKSAIYSPDVLVFRAANLEELPKAEWYFTDVISCAALKGPDLLETKNGGDVVRTYEQEMDRETMTAKIRLIFQIAVQKNITHMVLGAMGCGAYGNPPQEVARIFRRVIFGDKKRPGIRGLEEIVFAIYDDGENLLTFQNEFRDVLEKI